MPFMTTIAKRRVALLATPLLLTLLLLSPFGARVAYADQDSIDREDAGEKATDLLRAKANGDISPDRLVIVYERATSPNDPERSRVRARVGGKLLKADRAIARDVIRVTKGEAAARAADARRIPGVRDAYPDAVAVASLTVNDPLLVDEWGIAKIQATTAWDTSQGSGVKVAVLDCGIHATHPDIAGKVVLAQDFAGTGSTDDLCNHGTHVAGTIAANTNNGIGIAGVAPAAQLINGKVLDDTGSGFFSDIETAIVWAANNGAKVINLSLGADIACPASTQNAVTTALATSVIVAAAGNSGRNRAGAPANCTGVVGVAATDSTDARASFSNYGTNVDVAAPGVSIVSSVNPNVNGGAEYAFFSGTSMATPHTAGVAALIWATSYGTSPTAVQNRLFSSADRIAGTGTLWTYGRINAASAVAGGALGTHDVAVTALAASAATVTQGAVVTLTATVANQGTLAEPSVTVTLTDTTANTTIGSATVANLAAGASANVGFTWDTSTAAGGNHVLKATAATVPGETNTANNSQTTTVHVDAHDVAVTAIGAPASTMPGASATVTVDVANQGTATETFSVSLADAPPAGGTAGTISGSPVSATLLAGATRRLSFTWSTAGASVGAHTLTALATTVAGETNTANNVKSVTARVDTHDIAVTTVTSTPAAIEQSQSSTINVGLANLGSAAESFTVTLTDTPPGGVAATVGSSTVALAAGASTTIAITWATSTATALGTHTLTATASTVLGETSTANNSGSTAVSVSAPTLVHDVAVTAVVPKNPDVGLGESLRVRVTVANRGGAAETFNVSLSEQPDGSVIPSQSVTLAAGASTTLSFTWRTTNSTSLGSHTLTATAALAGDSNPANDTGSASVLVAAD